MLVLTTPLPGLLFWSRPQAPGKAIADGEAAGLPDEELSAARACLHSVSRAQLEKAWVSAGGQLWGGSLQKVEKGLG